MQFWKRKVYGYGRVEREREREVKREPYFDLLRGIAIIAVVSIHTLHYSNNLSTDITTLFYRNGINFAVPLFLVLSGYFCANFQSKQDFLHFLKKQIPKIYSFTFLFIHIHNRTVYSQTHINKYCAHKNIFVFNIRTILLYCTYYSVLRIASNDKRYKKLSYHFFYT